MWNHHESNQKIGQRVQKLKQVHIRTSPDASPENVDVFVGSDSTNSVTAPCLCKVERGKSGGEKPFVQGGTHTDRRFRRLFQKPVASVVVMPLLDI